jgi:hypothetical protein
MQLVPVSLDSLFKVNDCLCPDSDIYYSNWRATHAEFEDEFETAKRCQEKYQESGGSRQEETDHRPSAEVHANGVRETGS